MCIRDRLASGQGMGAVQPHLCCQHLCRQQHSCSRRIASTAASHRIGLASRCVPHSLWALVPHSRTAGEWPRSGSSAAPSVRSAPVPSKAQLQCRSTSTRSRAARTVRRHGGSNSYFQSTPIRWPPVATHSTDSFTAAVAVAHDFMMHLLHAVACAVTCCCILHAAACCCMLLLMLLLCYSYPGE